jgi:hypothetical protein
MTRMCVTVRCEIACEIMERAINEFHVWNILVYVIGDW